MTTTINLPWPPSVNSMWRTPRTGPLAGRTMLSEDGRKYRKAVADQVLVQRVRTLGSQARLSVHIEAWVPDRRRRDLDNILKAALDSLTHAGVWADDEQIDRLTIERKGIAGMLKIRVEVMTDQPELLEA
jgi:crossover junction endodeoxyribonuclease RusA